MCAVEREHGANVLTLKVSKLTETLKSKFFFLL